MTSITVNGTTYKIRYGYNCFCDSDIFDQVRNLLRIMQGEGIENDDDAANLGRVKDLFVTVRELLFLGMQKDNPLESIEAAGDLLDDYRDEAPEGESRGIVNLFQQLSEELVNEGFLSDILAESQAQTKKVTQRAKKK